MRHIYRCFARALIVSILPAGSSAPLVSAQEMPHQSSSSGQALPIGNRTTERNPEKKKPITADSFVDSGPVVFKDITAAAGLSGWNHKMGAADKKLIIDTNGSGVGLIDYDNDGWLDIYLVNGSTFDAMDGKETPPHAALFHNNHDGTFTDVAAKAGVTNDRWGFGVAIADYDNDGWPDIFVSNLERTVCTITITTAHSPMWPRRPESPWAIGRPAQPGATTTAMGGWIYLFPAMFISIATICPMRKPGRLGFPTASFAANTSCAGPRT